MENKKYYKGSICTQIVNNLEKEKWNVKNYNPNLGDIVKIQYSYFIKKTSKDKNEKEKKGIYEFDKKSYHFEGIVIAKKKNSITVMRNTSNPILRSTALFPTNSPLVSINLHSASIKTYKRAKLYFLKNLYGRELALRVKTRLVSSSN